MASRKKPFSYLIKRCLDYLLALILIVMTLPFVIFTFIALRISVGKNVIFTQDRPGLNGIIFKIRKFRTMNNKTDSQGNLLPDEERLTKVGKIVRKLSLDELPQIFNVLKGDMSFIGPRPLLVEYLPLYDEQQKKRHDVLPGVTGWAQVNGRNAISWEKKFELDVYYVENWSLWLDFKIILMTLKKVVVGSGVSAQGVATATKFTGSKRN